MDHLAALFAHATPTARTFFTGNLCKTTEFAGSGHLHFLKGGTLTLSQPGAADLMLDEPTLLFFPRDRQHRFLVDPERGADLACATVDLGGRSGNPIGLGLPDLIVLPLSAGSSTLLPVCELLLAEAFAPADGPQGEGRQVALDRLFEYLLIVIVRHVITGGLVEAGVLAGLADRRLARALTAMHEAPGRPWSLDDLAEVAGMSRTRFAEHFRAVVGGTAIHYLTGWRITVARQKLAKGKPVKTVAREVGYASAAAFSRVFARVVGHSPRAVR